MLTIYIYTHYSIYLYICTCREPPCSFWVKNPGTAPPAQPMNVKWWVDASSESTKRNPEDKSRRYHLSWPCHLQPRSRPTIGCSASRRVPALFWGGFVQGALVPERAPVLARELVLRRLGEEVRGGGAARSAGLSPEPDDSEGARGGADGPLHRGAPGQGRGG